MNDFEEIIILRKDFATPLDIVQFDIPGQTCNLKRLELKELKIQLDAGVVLTNVPYIELEFLSPSGGLRPASGGKLILTPSIQTVGGVNFLYAQYRGNNVILLKQNSQKTTLASKPIKLQLRDATGGILAKALVYLRMGLVEGDFSTEKYHEEKLSLLGLDRSRFPAEFLALPHVDRFQSY